ncbi:hypothetical protein AKJ51_03195 [candidate division MSBL1 archaeon SCGC-AAA382A20]|uniref:Antitoxin n=1 Tax=candidate division MSBL1 archaeon SCGC-AAA382A20 TaxID=1698280 RepID=A0A133VJS8_9EURY|nr:hypothetical protein AKJ51_03195 [candidate division MSBL1 archaeon SCGC-AAA382A20]
MPEMIKVSKEDFEEMKEEVESMKATIETLENEEVMKGIRKSQREFEEGKDQSWKEVKKEL